VHFRCTRTGVAVKAQPGAAIFRALAQPSTGRLIRPRAGMRQLALTGMKDWNVLKLNAVSRRRSVGVRNLCGQTRWGLSHRNRPTSFGCHRGERKRPKAWPFRTYRRATSCKTYRQGGRESSKACGNVRRTYSGRWLFSTPFPAVS
jgi:hypothetical protein